MTRAFVKEDDDAVVMVGTAFSFNETILPPPL